MQYVLLAYGAAFIATGLALGLQARATVGRAAIPRPVLWLAAAFALVHGASDWLQLSFFLEQREHGVPFVRLCAARVAVLAASFAILAAFGAFLVAPARRGRAAVLAAVGALGAWAIGAAALVHGPLGMDALWAMEGATRYLVGVPACALACVGLERARRRLPPEEGRTARLVGVAALAIGVYGFFTGVVVPRSDLAVARVLNVQTFGAAVHVPVELFRAASIAVVAVFLSEAFVRATAGRMRDDVGRDGFISLVAHDLRTPLGTVETGVTLLERLPPGEHASEREERVVRAIHSSVRTMRKIVSDLLDASRIESQRLSVSRERLELGPLLLRAVEWAPAEAMRGHTLRLEPQGPLAPVLADPVRVEQVLTNLLSNAGKYSYPESEIVLEARCDGRVVTISVTNLGPGIPAHDLPRVFARHYRTSAAESGHVPGLGLGLYIARGLVEAHGGRIWAESEAGGRTTFRFTLPVAARG